MQGKRVIERQLAAYGRSQPQPVPRSKQDSEILNRPNKRIRRIGLLSSEHTPIERDELDERGKVIRIH